MSRRTCVVHRYYIGLLTRPLEDPQKVSAEDILNHARKVLPGFKCPKDVVFRGLPKTATGKIQRVSRVQAFLAKVVCTPRLQPHQIQAKETSFEEIRFRFINTARVASTDTHFFFLTAPSFCPTSGKIQKHILRAELGARRAADVVPKV